MALNYQQVAVAVYEERHHAEESVHDLIRACFPEEDVGLFGPARRRPSRLQGYRATDHLDLETGLIPRLGSVLAHGPFTEFLDDAALGRPLPPSLPGFFLRVGLRLEVAKTCATEFAAGRTIVTLDRAGHDVYANQILRRWGKVLVGPSNPLSRSRVEVSTMIEPGHDLRQFRFVLGY
jgi:hypothetical protein